MRNYDEEIEQLRRDLEDLNTKKQDKETQLQRVLREQKQKNSEKTNTQAKKNTQATDRSGRAIFIGNRVIAITAGKFKENSGIVTDIKKRIIFTDANGVKQVSAPNNLLVQDD